MTNNSGTRMVELQNMVNKTVGVCKPEYGLKRKWTKKGQTIPLPYDIVELLLWDEGFRKMIDRGILYINSMQDKIDLGLEPEGAIEPENIKVLTDLQIKNLLTTAPYVAFVKEIKELTLTQIKNIINYSIANEIVDVQKCNYLTELTNIDILKTISQNKKLAKEESNN